MVLEMGDSGPMELIQDEAMNASPLPEPLEDHVDIIAGDVVNNLIKDDHNEVNGGSSMFIGVDCSSHDPCA